MYGDQSCKRRIPDRSRLSKEGKHPCYGRCSRWQSRCHRTNGKAQSRRPAFPSKSRSRFGASPGCWKRLRESTPASVVREEAGDREVASHQHVPVGLLGLVERLRVVGKAPGTPGHLWTAVNPFLLRWLRARPYVEPGRVRFFSRLMRGPKAGPRGTRQSSKSREEAHPAPRGQRRPCVSDVRGLLCSPPGQRRRPSATGRGTGLVLPLPVVLQVLSGQHGQGSAAVAMCHPRS